MLLLLLLLFMLDHVLFFPFPTLQSQYFSSRSLSLASMERFFCFGWPSNQLSK